MSENISANSATGVSTSFIANSFVGHFGFDSASSVFEPDVMLPSQLLMPDEEGLTGGERRLMAALLSDGIEAYINQAMAVLEGNLKKARAKADACEWVEESDQTYVFSFDNVCECLGINPEYLRLGLHRYLDTVREVRSTGSTNGAWKKIRRPRKQ